MYINGKPTAIVLLQLGLIRKQFDPPLAALPDCLAVRCVVRVRPSNFPSVAIFPALLTFRDKKHGSQREKRGFDKVIIFFGRKGKKKVSADVVVEKRNSRLI